MSAVSLSKDQTDNIQQKAITNFIRMSGYDMRFPQKVVYGAIKFGGLGFSQLYVESNCNKVQSVICHINNGTMLGKMMIINLNWSQLLSGIGKPLLTNDKDITYIQKNLFSELQMFLQEIDATIFIKNCWLPTIKREGDFFIMEKVQKLDISNIYKQIFNNWTLFFRVDLISDVMNISGNRIQDKFINKKLLHHYKSNSAFNWPQQKMPSLHTFNVWVKHYIKFNNLIQMNLEV
jgi:hypothetical protein